MAGEDFDPGTPQQALPQDQPPGRAVDMSQQSGLRKAWDAWTSRPENNAAMINFGLSLMQPIQPGQSRLGHWGEAVGAGAEASTRNIEEQRKQEAEDVAAAQKERALDIKERETGYYGEAVHQRAGADKTANSARARALAKWQDYNTKDIGIAGEIDPVTAGIQKMNPKWAKYNRADILNDPETARIARDRIMRTAAEDERYFGGGGGEGGGAGPPPGARIAVSKDGKRIWQDPQSGQWNPM
jgi:hypothetical protein